MHVGVDDLLQGSLSPRLGESPSECLQSGTHFDSLRGVEQEVFNSIIFQWCQWLLWLLLLLLHHFIGLLHIWMVVLLLFLLILLLHMVWLLMHVMLVSILIWSHLAAILAESILQLLLDWDHFVIERVISSSLNAGHHLVVNSWVLLANSLSALWDSSYRSLATSNKDLILLSLLLLLLLLLNDRLNECGLVVQVDAVLALQVVHVVVQECLVVAEFLPDGYQAYLVHGALGTHGLERE